MNYMAMAGWKTGDMLNGIEGIMNLAAASGEDLATTSDIVTDALTAFGLQAGDSIPNLNIRKGPGTDYELTGKCTGIGVFTIVEVKEGKGSGAGWGKLKSGAGWIALSYASRI